MILPELYLAKRANQKWKFSGMDNIDDCADKNHFLSYPFEIDYVYNSRGFRDTEWPESHDDLKNAVWCIGDSFTVGLGSPYLHTWPQRLSTICQKKVINVSMDGASNDWIARMACSVYDLARPSNMVLMWSYLHRREHPDTSMSDLDRRLHSVKSTMTQDFENFDSCRKLVQTHCADSNLIELAIPEFFTVTFDNVAWKKVRDPSWPEALPETLEDFLALPPKVVAELHTIRGIDQLLEFYTIQHENPHALTGVIKVKYLDRARDGHHFDLITADWAATQAAERLNRLANSKN